MGELADNLNDAVEKAKESRLNTIVATCVAVTATFMALCNVKDGNVCQNMAVDQSKSVDAWAYYQAKGTKQNMAEQMVDQLTIERDTTGTISTEAKATLDKKIEEYTAKAKTYETEKQTIKEQAEGYQADYDALNVHDDQFDMAEASISIGIALFGVTALTQKRWLLIVGLAFGGFGTFLGLAGFIGWSFHPELFARFLG